MRTCDVEDCGRIHKAMGYCNLHYLRWRKHGDPSISLTRMGLQAAQICAVDDCGIEALSRGWCPKHYSRWQRHGDPTKTLNPNRGKGRWDDGQGYIVLNKPDHPNANKTGKVFEHIVVMAESIGRPLIESETVHHLNGIRDDNRPENLELWASKHPAGQRVSDLVAFAHEILKEYDDD